MGGNGGWDGIERDAFTLLTTPYTNNVNDD